MKIIRIPIGTYQTNCYLVADEGSKEAFIIDPAGDLEQIKNLIDEKTYDLQYIILTHGHGDHIGAVEGLKEAYDAVLLIHEEDAEMLRDHQLNLTFRMGEKIEIEADQTFRDGETLMVGSLELKFIHTPGHSKGSSCILVEDALFSGDTLFFNSIGRTDLYGGDGRKIIESIKNKLLILPEETKVYPGHGQSTTIKNELKKNPFF
ncbi:MAG TPA: MBL fold metallo-hydrolase [Clostridia bacterium]|nr:MBL fold metallo-hydrolase [Clostridia bacterium]